MPLYSYEVKFKSITVAARSEMDAVRAVIDFLRVRRSYPNISLANSRREGVVYEDLDSDDPDHPDRAPQRGWDGSYHDKEIVRFDILPVDALASINVQSGFCDFLISKINVQSEQRASVENVQSDDIW